MKHTYATGPWYGIVANGGVALLPALSSPHLLHEVFEALKEGKGLGALLQALTSAFGTNLADLPPFAVVAFVGDDALIAVRGPLSVFIDGDAEQGAFSVSGARVTTWSESISSSPRSVVISSLPNGAAEFLLPIDGGVVLCSAVECLLSGVSSAAPSTAMVAKSEPRLVAVEVPQMEVAAEPLNVRAVKPDVSAKPLVPVPVPVPAPVPELPSNETETNEETLDISAETATSFYDTIGRGYDEMLSGETVVSSVESAAVRPSEEPEAELEHDRSAESAAPATIRHEPVLPVVIPTPVSPRAATPASLPPTQMIVGVPRFGSAAAPVSQQLPTVADAYVEVGGGVDELDGDHDGENRVGRPASSHSGRGRTCRRTVGRLACRGLQRRNATRLDRARDRSRSGCGHRSKAERRPRLGGFDAPSRHRTEPRPRHLTKPPRHPPRGYSRFRR